MFQHLTTQQAAAEIVGLINASPRSPRQDEIEAIIRRVQTRQDASKAPAGRSAQAEEYMRLHNWWADQDPQVVNDEAELTRRLDKVCEARERILEDGTDIQALAAVTLSFLIPVPIDFDNLPSVTEPHPDYGTACALATAVLRQGCQRTPPPSEIGTRIRAAMEPLRAAINAEGDLLSRDPGHAEAVALSRRLEGDFYALCKELWATPVRSFDDLLMRAEIAQFEARDWPPPYEPLPMLSEPSMDGGQGDFQLRQLAAAVLSLGQPLAIPAAVQDSAWSVRAAEYRRLRAELAAMWSVVSEAEDEEADRLGDAATAFEEQRIAPLELAIWRDPTRTVEHIVLLAEIAAHHENGLLDSLGKDDPYHDDRSAAELITAALDLGVNEASREHEARHYAAVLYAITSKRPDMPVEERAALACAIVATMHERRS